MPPEIIPFRLFSFCRWVSVLGLTSLLGCSDAPSPSLQTSDFVDALRENGFAPEIIETVVPTHETGGKSGLHLRVEGFDYNLGEYDLSSPESIRRLREEKRVHIYRCAPASIYLVCLVCRNLGISACECGGARPQDTID